MIYDRTRVRLPPHPLNRKKNMSFWKKALKKFKKQKDKDIEKLIENKYLNKLQKKLNEVQLDIDKVKSKKDH